ncbi:IS1182 family transposase [Lactobacillus crispatus]|nr:IS1182 family transposase [Lactobacillus crispatus]
MYQNYTTGQTALTLNLDFTIPNNHLATVIGWFVDSIPEDVLLGDSAKTGRPAYHPAMMLKILLFAYSRRVFSGRKIALMLEENLPMMVLAEHQQISYHTINNFRSSDHANELVKKCFLYFTNLLEQEGLINEGAIFIDGTKIEADANRYSFVWRKAVEKYHEKLKGQAVELYDELIAKEVVKAMAKEQVQTSQGLTELAQETEAEIEKLTEEIAQEPKAIPGGSARKAKRRALKKLLHKLRKDYVPRMKKYEEAEEVFAGRNSYSKTDHDATFMHMKEDHMKNGQLKPGYNIQVATTDQYVVDFALYPNPTDFKTLEPFLKQMTTMDKFDKIVADAGYGSEYNYSMLEEEYSDKQYYIPYTMYEKEQTRKYKNDPTKLANWFYDEEDDYYLDQNGVRFSFKCYSRRKDKSTGQVRDFKVYEADKFQLTPELERLAKTKSGRQRQVRYNPNWQYLKEKAKGVLQSPEGRYIYSKRKYDVEPVFGHLKNVFGMRRTHLRGKKKVETDVGIAFMMMNLSKYWNRRWSKDQSSLHKNKNNKKKTVKQLKLRVGLIVFWYLKVSFFPDTFLLGKKNEGESMSLKYIAEILPALLSGAGMTLSIFFWTLILATPLGILVSLGEKSKFKPLRWLVNFYVWIMRGTPLLLQLIFVFYGLPIIHIVFPRYQAALFAFVLNYAAYFAEIFRGGFQSIDEGQFEAAKVLRLSRWQTMTKIIIPQVIKIVLPSIGNEVINLVKDSSLVYVIGLGDLLRAGNVAMARDVTLVPLVLVGVIYLLLIGICAFVLKKLENHFSYYK